MSNILIIEPFYGGSHKQLIEMLKNKLSIIENASIFTMTAKKWHWRARVSALQISCQIPTNHNYEVLFCSSVLNLAELCGLRPDIAAIKKKIIYFHENQLIYPVRDQKDRDFQYGYNQVTSALSADLVLFNSHFNMTSFLTSIGTFLNIIPDFKVKQIDDRIRPKCRVLYFPVERPLFDRDTSENRAKLSDGLCHIVWPHRWEHDKNPDLMFRVLFRLKAARVPFRVSIVGERFSDVPQIFEEARSVLRDEIENWGFINERDRYYRLLNEADVVVSTAEHEFYGVAMLEAASYGCVAVCPRRLSYPELFGPMEIESSGCNGEGSDRVDVNGAVHFYNTERQLEKILTKFCNSAANGYGLKKTDMAQRTLWLGRFWWSEEMLRNYENIFLSFY